MRDAAAQGAAAFARKSFRTTGISQRGKHGKLKVAALNNESKADAAAGCEAVEPAEDPSRWFRALVQPREGGPWEARLVAPVGLVSLGKWPSALEALHGMEAAAEWMAGPVNPKAAESHAVMRGRDGRPIKRGRQLAALAQARSKARSIKLQAALAGALDGESLLCLLRSVAAPTAAAAALGGSAEAIAAGGEAAGATGDEHAAAEGGAAGGATAARAAAAGAAAEATGTAAEAVAGDAVGDAAEAEAAAAAEARGATDAGDEGGAAAGDVAGVEGDVAGREEEEAGLLGAAGYAAQAAAGLMGYKRGTARFAAFTILTLSAAAGRPWLLAQEISAGAALSRLFVSKGKTPDQKWVPRPLPAYSGVSIAPGASRSLLHIPAAEHSVGALGRGGL